MPASLKHLLFRRIDNSPIFIFRMLFGLLMFLEAVGALAIGWVDLIFNDPPFTFTFIGFEWLHPQSDWAMYLWFVGIAWCGAMVGLGWHYRFHAILLTVLWTGTYLLHKTGYNNHHYLLVLLCGFMCLIDAHHYASLDAKRRPRLMQLHCPNWYRVVFILQLAIVFFFASKAKVYPGWLEGDFFGVLFYYTPDHWLYGGLLQEPWVHKMLIYGGIVFDLLIIPLLIWDRTRMAAFIGYILFNIINATLFEIGVFPWLVMATSVFFFEPETIRRKLFWTKPKPDADEMETAFHRDLGTKQKFGIALFSIYFIIQILLPLRHHLIQGDVLWTEEGHRLSWRMMLRTRYAQTTFLVRNSEGFLHTINPDDYFPSKQSRVMQGRPDMIWQFAQHLEKKYESEGYTDVEIYVNSQISINGSPLYLFIDPTVNLAAEEWHLFKHEQWLMPSQLKSGFSLN